jgi:hypothetical protein
MKHLVVWDESSASIRNAFWGKTFREIFFHFHQYALMFTQVTGRFSVMFSYINIILMFTRVTQRFSFMFTYINIILMFNWVTGRFSFMFTYINILWYLPELQVGFLSCSLTSISFDIYLGYRWVFFHVSYTSIAFDVYTSYRWIFFHLHLHQYPLMFTWVR